MGIAYIHSWALHVGEWERKKKHFEFVHRIVIFDDINGGAWQGRSQNTS